MSEMDKLKKMAQEYYDMKKQARRDKKTIKPLQEACERRMIKIEQLEADLQAALVKALSPEDET